MFINDFPKALLSQPILFADDTTIILSDCDPDKLKEKMEQEIKRAESWLSHNELHLNKDKSQTIHFTLSHNFANKNSVNSVKLLGIYLDQSVTWNKHIDFVINKLSKSYYIIRKLKSNISSEFLKMSYFALFHSHITYGILLWGSAPRCRQIFLWQKKVIRVMAGLSYRESCRGHFKRLNILTTPCIFILYAILYVKSNLNLFSSGNDNHCYGTRFNNLLKIPKARIAKTFNTYSVYGVKYFNLLPDHIKVLNSSNFKIQLKNILLKSEGYNFDEIEQFLRNTNFK
jgi:hypothetical protein